MRVGSGPVLLRDIHVTRNECILLLCEGMYVPQGTKLAEELPRTFFHAIGCLVHIAHTLEPRRLASYLEVGRDDPPPRGSGRKEDERGASLDTAQAHPARDAAGPRHPGDLPPAAQRRRRER